MEVYEDGLRDQRLSRLGDALNKRRFLNTLQQRFGLLCFVALMEFAYRGSDALVVVGIGGTDVAGVDFRFVGDEFDDGADVGGGEAMRTAGVAFGLESVKEGGRKGSLELDFAPGSCEILVVGIGSRRSKVACAWHWATHERLAWIGRADR